MLEEAIELLLKDDDLVFDHFRSTIDKILNGDTSQKTRRHYDLAKKIHLQQIEGYCIHKNIHSQEQLHYDILEMCLFFEDEELEYASAHQLSNVMTVDSLLKMYAEHHVLDDGIWAKLKYQIQITTKTDVMRDALKLL